eukprot:NODE_967_length_2846_cov_0.660357.p3 type:complete len:190 gc:universal NODE_967_length_2846_cov_0.660357:142-711(+)
MSKNNSTNYNSSTLIDTESHSTQSTTTFTVSKSSFCSNQVQFHCQDNPRLHFTWNANLKTLFMEDIKILHAEIPKHGKSIKLVDHLSVKDIATIYQKPSFLKLRFIVQFHNDYYYIHRTNQLTIIYLKNPKEGGYEIARLTRIGLKRREEIKIQSDADCALIIGILMCIKKLIQKRWPPEKQPRVKSRK